MSEGSIYRRALYSPLCQALGGEKLSPRTWGHLGQEPNQEQSTNGQDRGRVQSIESPRALGWHEKRFMPL